MYINRTTVISIYIGGDLLRKLIALLGAICLLLTLIGCQKQDNSIRIGLNLELSGRLAQYGRECLNGAKLAQKQINQSGGINGKALNLIIMDNRSENSDAALAIFDPRGGRRVFHEKSFRYRLIGNKTYVLKY